MSRLKLTSPVLGLLLSGLAAIGCGPRVVVVHDRPGAPPAGEEVIVEREPPADQAEDSGPPPSAEHIWIKGHWHWNGSDYVWQRGRWETRRAGHEWVHGHWMRRGRGSVWIEGHWRRL